MRCFCPALPAVSACGMAGCFWAPCFNVLSVCFWGFVSPPELTGGVLTRDPEGLCHPCEREDGFYIDAWQRAGRTAAPVPSHPASEQPNGSARTPGDGSQSSSSGSESGCRAVPDAPPAGGWGSRRGEEGDWPGGDEEKMDALRFVVTGDLNTCEIRVASLGQYDSPPTGRAAPAYRLQKNRPMGRTAAPVPSHPASEQPNGSAIPANGRMVFTSTHGSGQS